jgi:hypothetical protein
MNGLARRANWVTVAIAVLGFSSLAEAYPIIFATGPTTTTGGAQVNAEAFITFNASAHTVTIQLLDLEVNPTDVSQLISGFEFDLTNLSGSVTPGINSATVGTFDVAANGFASADPQSSTWITQSLSGTSVSLCEICRLGGGSGPQDLIIGGPDPAQGDSDQYTNANGSIAGNGPHNPFILGSGANYSAGVLKTVNSTPTWVLSIPQITSTTSISQVRFFFGTTYSTNFDVPDSSIITPEPDPIVLIAGGLALIAAASLARFRLRRR